MIEQDRVAATVFSLAGEDWVGHLLLGEEAAIALPEAGIEAIRLGDLYEGVDMSEDTGRDGDETKAEEAAG